MLASHLICSYMYNRKPTSTDFITYQHSAVIARRIDWSLPGRAKEAQNFIRCLGDLDAPLLPIRLTPHTLQHVVGDDDNEEADVVVLGCPAVLVGVVRQILWIARVYLVLGLLRHLGLIRLGDKWIPGQEVAQKLMPRAAHIAAVEPSTAVSVARGSD